MYKTAGTTSLRGSVFNYNPSFTSGLLGTIFGERKTAIRGGYSSFTIVRVAPSHFSFDQNSYIFDEA
jgi:hypothetical protein